MRPAGPCRRGACAGCVPGRTRCGLGEVPQLSHRLRRDERGTDHTAFDKLGQPDRIQLVGLRAPGDVLHVAGVHEPAVQVAGLQQVEERAAVRACRFRDHPLDTLAHKPVAEFEDRVRGDRPGLLNTPAFNGVVRDTQADHPGRLHDVDRRPGRPSRHPGLLLTPP